jgi:hypothetical protein
VAPAEMALLKRGAEKQYQRLNINIETWLLMQLAKKIINMKKNVVMSIISISVENRMMIVYPYRSASRIAARAYRHQRGQ